MLSIPINFCFSEGVEGRSVGAESCCTTSTYEGRTVRSGVEVVKVFKKQLQSAGAYLPAPTYKKIKGLGGVWVIITLS